MFKKFIILLVVSATSFSAVALSAKKVLEQVQENYANLNAFEADLTYQLFRGHDSEKVIESFNSLHCKNESGEYRKVSNTEFITVSSLGVSVQVNHNDRLILLSNPTNSDLVDASLKSSLSYCNDTYAVETKEGTDVTLLFNKMVQLPFSKVVVSLTKDNWISSLTLCYSSEQNFSKDFYHQDYDQVKMKITYDDFKTKYKDKESLIDVSKYLTIVDGNFQTTTLYQDYKLLDYRTRK
ncbi:MAG: hypothetical protein MK078_05980 [Crocinitomicaceae bacterium]|nr:hypothetical protein [Crocinitomicaceae bacterium]